MIVGERARVENTIYPIKYNTYREQYGLHHLYSGKDISALFVVSGYPVTSGLHPFTTELESREVQACRPTTRVHRLTAKAFITRLFETNFSFKMPEAATHIRMDQITPHVDI